MNSFRTRFLHTMTLLLRPPNRKSPHRALLFTPRAWFPWSVSLPRLGADSFLGCCWESSFPPLWLGLPSTTPALPSKPPRHRRRLVQQTSENPTRSPVRRKPAPHQKRRAVLCPAQRR